MTITVTLFVWLQLATVQDEVGWQPPDNPNPQAILQEAHADTRAGEFKVALAKHLWYHQNALRIQPAQSGVRLSFALNYWKELADAYPPAMAKLVEARDAAAAAVVANQDARQSFPLFQEFAAINRTLNEEVRTRELFSTLHNEQPEVAKRVYLLAEPALVRGKEYQLCSYYLEPDAMLRRMAMAFEASKKLAKSPKFGGKQFDFGKQRFTSNVATLVALLAVNMRTAEAEKTAAAAKEQWNDQSFHAAIDEALKGKVPDPWP
jgi:hypothetical protein